MKKLLASIALGFGLLMGGTFGGTVALAQTPAATAPAEAKAAAPAAAPVSRGSSGRENVVRLTAAEREMAELMGMKPEEYARNKIALKKEGKLQ